MDSDVAALIIALASIVAVAVVIVAIVSLTRTLREVRAAVEEMRSQTLPMMADMQTTVRQANTELERVDVLLGTAESISGTVDAASRLAYLALSNPVIKAMAFAAGTSRAARRFRRRN